MRDHRVKEPEAKHYKLASAIVEGKPIQTSMIDAGYAPRQARKGMSGLPKCVIKLMPKLAKSNLMDLGSMKPQDQETLVRGRLAYNTIVGQDKGVLSAKALGSDRRVNMFTPDVQTGIVVISVPAQAGEDKTKLLESGEE